MAKAENKEGWEVSEFPILCETCLGVNPYMRMTRNVFGDECKVCSRPFTVFRWHPGPKMRFKKTEICQSCAKMKNVCQTCLLDIQYNLPVQVRDTVLQIEGEAPKSEINRAFFNRHVVEKKLDQGDSLVDYSKVDPKGKEVLKMISRTSRPNYTRNLAHICSFWVKGNCKRGDECPYRHELDARDEQLSHQKIKDRYYGSNDPVAIQMLDKLPRLAHLEPPEDKSVTTMVVFGLENSVTEKTLNDYFYSFGPIHNIYISENSHTAFIKYEDRESAVSAMGRCLSGVTIDGKLYKVAWSFPKKSTTRREFKRKSTPTHAKDNIDEPVKDEMDNAESDHSQHSPDFEEAEDEESEDDGNVPLSKKSHYHFVPPPAENEKESSG